MKGGGEAGCARGKAGARVSFSPGAKTSHKNDMSRIDATHRLEMRWGWTGRCADIIGAVDVLADTLSWSGHELEGLDRGVVVKEETAALAGIVLRRRREATGVVDRIHAHR